MLIWLIANWSYWLIPLAAVGWWSFVSMMIVGDLKGVKGT